MPDNNVSIRQIQDAIQRQDAEWEAGATSMTALSQDEQQIRLGVDPPEGELSVHEVAVQAAEQRDNIRSQILDAVGAPAAYDLRNVGGKNFTTAVKDQGACGSCVAFGSTAAIETTFKVGRNDAALAVDLSEAQLFYCHGRAKGAKCNTGWWPEDAMKACQATGIADDACYRYTAGDQNCTGLCSDWASRVSKITGYTNLTNKPADMKTWLSTKGSLSVCFVVYNDFFAYKSGVYKHVTGAEAGGHCVEMVGYDDNAKCWICKNSWGTGWGDKGFFKIAYGDCGIESWGVFAVNGVTGNAWEKNTKVRGLWAIDQTRNAWAYIDRLGWRRIAYDNDVILYNLLSQLCAARMANRPIDVYQESNVIKQVYVW